MKNLEKLEQAIYNALPRLKEFKKGTKFKIKNMPFDYEFLYFINDDEFTEEISEVATLYNNEIDVFDYEYFKNQDITIICQEIALNDVLEFLEIKHSNKDFFIDTCGQLQRIIERTGVTWDLSKPLLKDQSEELINYLTELI